MQCMLKLCSLIPRLSWKNGQEMFDACRKGGESAVRQEQRRQIQQSASSWGFQTIKQSQLLTDQHADAPTAFDSTRVQKEPQSSKLNSETPVKSMVPAAAQSAPVHDNRGQLSKYLIIYFIFIYSVHPVIHMTPDTSNYNNIYIYI
jgi:hypothetical protein